MIGNSHAAAVWQAWKNRAPAVAEGFALTVFASRAKTMEDMEWCDGALVPINIELEKTLARTSGGKTRIEIADYDAVVLVGFGFSIDIAALVVAGGTVDHLHWGPVQNLMSRSCYAAMLSAYLEASNAIAFLNKLRSFSNVPVLICPTPFQSEAMLDDPRYGDHPLIGKPGLGRAVVGKVMRISRDFEDRHGCEILWQGDSTIAPSGFTKSEFNVGSLTLQFKNRVRRKDYKHMNEDFGLLRLMSILRRLDELSEGRVLV